MCRSIGHLPVVSRADPTANPDDAAVEGDAGRRERLSLDWQRAGAN